MDLKKYQELVKQTAIFPKETALTYCALGLNGEAGEVAEKVKKFIRDGEELDNHAVAKEIGDVLWYCTAMADDLGYTLEEIMQINHDKLMKRKETGTLQGSGDDRELFKENLRKLTEPKHNPYRIDDPFWKTTLSTNKPTCEFCRANKGMTCNDCSTSNKPI